MSKTPVEMVESLTDLPPNILLEILVRLPLKTLFASRCVCKTFRDLASPNPHFIQLHSSNATQTLIFQFGDAFEPTRIIRILDPELRRLEFKPIFQLPKFGRSEVNYYRSNFRELNKFALVNSYNGLLYFVRKHTRDERALVCNPVTNEYMVIPDVDGESRLRLRTKSMWLGFSPGTNQYKVLRIFSSIREEPVEVGAQVLVFGPSFSWRNIRDMPLGSGHSWDTVSTFLDGFIYWLDHSRKDIVYFDFEREVFGDMALPPGLGEDQLRVRDCMTISVLEGCLSLSCNDVNAYRVDIWIMKKNGNRENWSKKFSVDTVTPINKLLHGHFKPLQFLRNGELLMLWINNDLVAYDLNNKTFRLVGLNRMTLNPKVVAFTPSLVSLKDALSIDKVLLQTVRPRYLYELMFVSEFDALLYYGNFPVIDNL